VTADPKRLRAQRRRAKAASYRKARRRFCGYVVNGYPCRGRPAHGSDRCPLHAGGDQ
jgi:hypothetical protein